MSDQKSLNKHGGAGPPVGAHWSRRANRVGRKRQAQKTPDVRHVNVHTSVGPAEGRDSCRFENSPRYAQIGRRRSRLTDIYRARIVKSGKTADDPGAAAPAEAGAASGSLSALDVGDDAVDDEDVLRKGTSVGRYLVLERLGAGAMGVVYAAYDPELDRKIALKLLRAQEGRGGEKARRQERLVREAKAIAKLSHPNVVGIFDVGLHEGQVFMAMEYLSGGTLRDWMNAKKRPWREIVKMFIEVGQGLAAAHAEGLIHRDFKPDNVLLDKAGKPKVADFGLVRLGAMGLDAPGLVEEAFLEISKAASVPLTRTGALAGTPAYMAPEQFLGRPIDARTDQFAFCVALYEALYGDRPFAGETVLALGGQVTKGQVRATPKSSDVPTWVRACVARGLQVGPSDRHPGIDRLLTVLAIDPGARRRRRLLAGAASLLVVGGALAVRHVLLSKRHEIDNQAAEHIRAADAFLAEAAAKRRESRMLRDQAFAAFDGYDRDKGETPWTNALATSKAAEAGYQRGVQRLEAAVALTPRRDLKDRIADALVDYIEMDGRSLAEREAGLRHLASFDEGGARTHRLNAPAIVRIDTTPAGIAAQIETYDPGTHFLAGPPRKVGTTPLELSLEPGSYRLTFEETATHVGFHYPVLLGAGEKLTKSIRVPIRSNVPKGFVFVPAGRFLFGSDNEELRGVFLETIPLHAVDVPAFIISKYETTIGDWLAFVDTLPAKQQEARRPHGNYAGLKGSIDVRRTPDAKWQITFQPAHGTYHALEREPFAYRERNRRVSQDWLRFPVTGISAEDALEYLAWLDRSGRVTGARLCTEREWERAARGADARDFPHGDQLSPDDANFDLTYGRKSEGLGPDEVGSHPASQSPFGVSDLSGNVWDIAASVLDQGQMFVIRGGSYYHNRLSALTSNRSNISSTTRDQTIGLRVCASARFEPQKDM
jgi:serine/threonine protein kinase/formylglycine-generating enzyme required for sulfatase activity